MPFYGGNNNFDPRRLRPYGSGRHFNPYWHSRWRRRAPSWLLAANMGKPPVKKKLWLWWVLVGLVVIIFAAILTLTILSIVAPLTVATALYTERYNSLSLDKEYALSFETTRIFDRKGVLLYEKQPDEGLREYAKIDRIPKVLIDATTAAEDPTFFENKGVDPYAIMRAVYINFTHQGSSGASTITQQVARILYLPPEQRKLQTLDRKIDEAILAIKITDQKPKDEILEKYLNNIYYGNLAYGIQAATLGYFGKDVSELTLAEASMLAGLPQAPSLYDPTQDYDQARKRQKIVLGLMVKYNRVSQSEADAAYRVDLQSQLVDRRVKKAFIQAPHFVNFVLQQLQGELDSPQLAALTDKLTPEDFKQGGFEITTSIDLDMVNRAQSVVKSNVDQLKKLKASNAALVAMRPDTGEILAMVGSTDFNDTANQGQFNAAIARRQPGSALKPLTYAFAMQKGWTAATVLADVKTQFPSADPAKPYIPQNYDGSFHGPVPIRNALGSSLNIPAVKALQFDGVDTFVKEAKDMGVTFLYGPERYGLTLTLGGGEVRLLDLVGAYSVFDNYGDKVPPISILKIMRHGEVVYQFDPGNVNRKNVISPQIAYVITNILSDNTARLLAFDRNNPLVLDRPAAAKTGTSNDYVDSWTIGYTPDFVVGIWVGNNNNKPMDGVAGAIGGGVIWNSFMNSIYKDPKLVTTIKPGGQLQTDFVRPNGIVEATVCNESGLLPNDACPQRHKEIFPANAVPTKVSDIHHFVKVPRERKPEPAKSDPANPNPVPTVVGPPPAPLDTYCLPDDSWPEDQLENKLFYIYPPELQDWAAKQGHRPPPTQPCGVYVPPTPTPSPTPAVSPTPTIDLNATPTPTGTPNVSDGSGGTPAATPVPGTPGIPPTPGPIKLPTDGPPTTAKPSGSTPVPPTKPPGTTPKP